MSNEDLRIAIDARTAIAVRTGIGHYAQELARAIVCRHRANAYLIFEPKSGAIGADMPEGVQVYRTRATPLNKYARDYWENVILPRRLSAWGASVWHSTGWLLPIRRLPQATVVTVHDLTQFKFPKLHKPLYGRLFRFQARRALALADEVIADSEATRRDLIETLSVSPERISVIHLGVDPVFNPVKSPPAANRLRAAGSAMEAAWRPD